MFYLSVYAKRVTFANCYWLYLFCCYLLLSTMSMMLSIKRMSSVELINYAMKGDWNSSKVWFFLCFANIWIEYSCVIWGIRIESDGWYNCLICRYATLLRFNLPQCRRKSEKRTEYGVGMVVGCVCHLYDAGDSRLKHFSFISINGVKYE